jgi:hypothetical protein
MRKLTTFAALLAVVGAGALSARIFMCLVAFAARSRGPLRRCVALLPRRNLRALWCCVCALRRRRGDVPAGCEPPLDGH